MGTVKTTLTLDRSPYESGLDQAKRSGQKFAKGLAARIGGVFAAGAVIAGVRTLNREIDELGKNSRKIGLSPEFLQQLRFAAKQTTNLSESTIDMGLQRFARRLGEAQKGAGELRDTLEQAGIALFDGGGQARSVEAVLMDLADTIATASTEQEKLRIAFKAFDSEGASLVNTMRDGSAGLKDFADQARRAGIIIEEETIKRVEDLNDKLDVQLGKLKRTGADLVSAFLTFGERIGEGAAILVGHGDGLDAPRSFDARAEAAKREQQAAAAQAAKNLEDEQRMQEDIARGIEKMNLDEAAAKQLTFDTFAAEVRLKQAAARQDAEAVESAERRLEVLKQTKTLMGQFNLARGRAQMLAEQFVSLDEAAKKQEEAGQIRQRLADLQQALGDPRNIQVSSLRAIGGGGVAVTPNESALQREVKKQTDKLEAIRRSIDEIRQNGRTFR